ncbi:4'-phosphopantetheinyl transferase family protein [Streptomyces orinoci]|uniref:4'-phosphopantetheinyl transferase superfamily protein n=1 Tax=Streptomyces orinoci TaxID=67339 RepID=A0ABV3K802_STRON|nr:4'-phosphopantetheinyl transferase superfamily protein [Streptomyces orinoci]
MTPRTLGEHPLPGRWTPGGPPQLWLLRTADHTPDASETYEHALDARELARATAFRHPHHRARYLSAHLWLRRLLGAYLDLDPAKVELIREPCPLCSAPHGRPAVPGAPLHFNLSHAGDLALYAFASTPVGVDIEERPEATAVDDILPSLHPREIAELTALTDPDERRSAFARCWTRKEAYLKGTGAGLAESLSLTYVGCGPDPVSPAGWLLSDVAVGPDHTAALGVKSPEARTS